MSKGQVVEKNSDNFSLERLNFFKLPVIKNVSQLLEILDISSEEETRYFYKENRKKYLYNHIYIPKKNGQFRLIEIPDSKIMSIQRAINDVILKNFSMTKSCCGFVKGKSLINNAKPHVQSKTLMKIDIKDFFPSIKLNQVVYQFRYFGYGMNVSRYLGYLCVNENYSLPQGAPTSPSLSNLVCIKMDKRIEKYCKNKSLKYTRYADDITISSKEYLNIQECNKIRDFIYFILKDEGFEPNYKKYKRFVNGQRLQVTGIIVNDKINVSKKYYRELDNAIRYVRMNGLQTHLINIGYDADVDYLNHILGLVSFVSMVNKEKGKYYLEEINSLVDDGFFDIGTIEFNTELLKVDVSFEGD